MSPTGKILLGIATISPFILFSLWIVSLVSASHAGIEGVEASSTHVVSVGFGFLMAAVAGAGTVALFVYYLVHILNNPRLDSQSRLLWALLICFFVNIAFVVYWIFQIWREEDDRIDHSYTN